MLRQNQKVILILFVAAAVLVTGVKIVNQREAKIFFENAETEQVTTKLSETTKELTTEKITTTVTSTTETTTKVEETEAETTKWDGPVLNSYDGEIEGPSGTEKFYNRNMSKVIKLMRNRGYDYEYWVRDDGVKMYGKYVMCAANLHIRPKGTILETSLGTAMVCDECESAYVDTDLVDVAVTWVV